MAYQFPQPYTGAYIKGLFDKIVSAMNLTGIIKADGSDFSAATEGTDYTHFKGKIVTLSAAGWSDNQQTVSIPGVTSDDSYAVIAAPDQDSIDAWSESGCKVSAQGTNTVTFVCESVPSEDLTINVVHGEVDFDAT